MPDENYDHLRADVTQLNQDVALIQQEMVTNSEMTREILDIVKGNGGRIGLVTQACLNKASIKRAWWWLGGVSLSLLGIFGWVVKRG